MKTYLPFTLSQIFYNFELMPCCGKPRSYFKGPRGGDSLNIMCFHCGQKFNTCHSINYIVKI